MRTQIFVPFCVAPGDISIKMGNRINRVLLITEGSCHTFAVRLVYLAAFGHLAQLISDSETVFCCCLPVTFLTVSPVFPFSVTNVHFNWRFLLIPVTHFCPSDW